MEKITNEKLTNNQLSETKKFFALSLMCFVLFIAGTLMKITVFFKDNFDLYSLSNNCLGVCIVFGVADLIVSLFKGKQRKLHWLSVIGIVGALIIIYLFHLLRCL